MAYFKLFGAKKNASKGLTDAAYEGYARAFDGAVLNSIHIQKTAAAAPISVGHSKMGGMPDLPEGFSWPYFTGTDFDGVTASRPLAFLAQFNLGEVAPHDRDGRLPGSGMLYFFYEAHTMLWGFDPADRGCARVFHVKENAKLTRKNFTDDLEEQYRLPEMALNFSTLNELPDIAEQRFGIVDFDEYQQACTRYGCPMNESCSTKLLAMPTSFRATLHTSARPSRAAYTAAVQTKGFRMRSAPTYRRTPPTGCFWRSLTAYTQADTSLTGVTTGVFTSILKRTTRAHATFLNAGACCSACDFYDRTRKDARRPAVYGQRPRTFCNAQPRHRVVQ